MDPTPALNLLVPVPDNSTSVILLRTLSNLRFESATSCASKFDVIALAIAICETVSPGILSLLNWHPCGLVDLHTARRPLTSTSTSLGRGCTKENHSTGATENHRLLLPVVPISSNDCILTDKRSCSPCARCRNSVFMRYLLSPSSKKTGPSTYFFSPSNLCAFQNLPLPSSSRVN